MDSDKKENRGDYESDNYKDIIAYTPGGMHVCYLSDPIHLEYASVGLCRMLGYGEEEFEAYTDGLYLKNIVDDDKDIFMNFVKILAHKCEKKTCEYRMKRKDGTIIYVSDTMDSILCSDGIVRGYSSVTDITDLEKSRRALINQKEKYEKLYNEILISERRFRAISKSAGILFVEYDREKKEYTSLINLENVLMYSENELKNVACTISKDRKSCKLKDNYGYICCLLHRDDVKIAENAANILMGNRESSIRVRLLCGDGEYHWFNIDNYLSGDGDSNITGCIRNIDNERQEISKLEARAKIDPMTGLMNKTEGFKDIGLYIKNKPNEEAAFFLFDIDDFKSVNDNYGHELGDNAIKYLAECILSVFRKDDIVARFGGDEFFVFMKNIKNHKTAFEKAKRLIKIVGEFKDSDADNLKLSISAGIAFVDKHKCDIGEEAIIRSVFRRADKALYEAKLLGKGIAYSID